MAEAPEIEGTDLNGEPLRLSEFRGKVVVLDFWADWCPHCRAMYGHERELVEKYPADKFALLGINCDERARVDSVIKSGQVTWRSWFDGPQGPISTQWQVEGFPTVYVLDREGVIRFKGVRGPQLEDAINMLLERIVLADAHGSGGDGGELEVFGRWYGLGHVVARAGFRRQRLACWAESSGVRVGQ